MEISVVVPVFNERENIPKCVKKVNDAMIKKFKEFELIFVNDGSNDGSYEVLEKMRKEYKFVKVYHLTVNNGQSAALDAGFKKAKGELILMMDGDLQTDPEDVYKLLNFIPKYDFINGKRKTREDGFKRKLASKIGNGFRNFITGDNIEDTGCPLKLFKRKVIKKIKMFDGMHRFLPTLAKYNGFKVIEVSVNHFDRIYGKSKYKVFGRGFKAFKDVFAVRWMKNRILKWKIVGEEND